MSGFPANIYSKEQGIGFVGAPPYPAPELVELYKSETLPSCSIAITEIAVIPRK